MRGRDGASSSGQPCPPSVRIRRAGHDVRSSPIGRLDMNCNKCGAGLRPCPACKGGTASGVFGKLTCSKCNNTGMQCPSHGGHHGR